MKTPFYFGILCLLFLFSCNNEPAEVHPLQPKFDEYFKALTELEEFNGVIFVKQGNEEIIHEVYNLQNDPEHSLHVNRNSQFDIHSVSKVMLRFLLAQLEAENKIDRKAALQTYLTDFPRGDEITIEMLMDHTSGLPRDLTLFEGNKIDLSTEQIIEEIKKEPLLFEPGQGAQYSNLGYELLYFTVGQLTQQTFAQHLVDALFNPLNMENSGAHFYTTNNNLKELAANHELSDTGFVQVDNVLPDETKQARIFSTSQDLMRFLDKLREDPLSSNIAKDSVIQQSGGSDGIRAHVHIDFQSNYQFVLLTNIDAIPFEKTIKDMINILEGKPYDVPKAINRKAVAVDKTTLQQYEGIYVFADFGGKEVIAEVQGEQLAVFEQGDPPTFLAAENDSVFFEDPKAPESFEFIKNDRGTYDVLMGFRGVRLKGVRK